MARTARYKRAPEVFYTFYFPYEGGEKLRLAPVHSIFTRDKSYWQPCGGPNAIRGGLIRNAENSPG